MRSRLRMAEKFVMLAVKPKIFAFLPRKISPTVYLSESEKNLKLIVAIVVTDKGKICFW